MKHHINLSTATVVVTAMLLSSRASAVSFICSDNDCIYARHDGASGAAIRTSGTGDRNGIFAASDWGSAVYAQAGSGTGVTVRVQTGYGINVSTSDTLFGVPILAQSPSGNPSVWGIATSTSKNGIGVKGEAKPSGTAIWGYNPGFTAAYFNGKAYAEQWNTISDARRKKDVKDLSYGLPDVLKLRPVTFKWKEGDANTHVGFIAQEVEKVVPEVVSRAKEPSASDVLTVDYTEIVPVLVRAVQEQNKIIVKQNARIEALERVRQPVALGNVGVGAAALFALPLGLVLAFRRRRADS